MFLSIPKIKHVSSINHDGKVVILVCDKDGKLFYSIRQEGHEDNYDKTTLKGWEDWSELSLPDEPDDESVREKELEEFSDTEGNSIIRSLYRTKNETAVAPVQLVSGIGHLYIFRQLKSAKITVDRFVLDGLTNQLVRKLQVRFKRSRQQFKPMQPDTGSTDKVDSYDFRDANNKPFYEPTTELSILPECKQGWFSVVLLPTQQTDQYRWNIFVYNVENDLLELWSMAASKEGLFDIRDHKARPGITKRVIRISQTEGENEAQTRFLNITNGPVASKYDTQMERMTEAGPQLLRDRTKVMLVIPTDHKGKAVAISFSVNGDGLLSELSDAKEWGKLNGYTRNILLPINSLDEIKGIAQDKAEGLIDAINKGKKDDAVWIETDAEALPIKGDKVEISRTEDFQGLHQVVRATTNTVVIETGEARKSLGTWEQQLDPQSSLLFDGMITAFRKMGDNRIRITSPKHGLKKGDELQLEGDTEVEGSFAVQHVKRDSFSINMKWRDSQVVNVRLKSKQRRGIHFDADGDAVKTPILPLKNPTTSQYTGRTISTWVYPEDLSEGKQLVASSPADLLNLSINDGQMIATLSLLNNESSQQQRISLVDPTLLKSEWIHFAAAYDYDSQTKQTTVYLMRDGKRVAEQTLDAKPSPNTSTALVLKGQGQDYLSTYWKREGYMFDVSQTDFSFESWIKTTVGGPILAKTGFRADKHVLTLLVDDDMGYLAFSMGNEIIIQSEQSVKDDEWHHVAVTMSHRYNKLSLFIDGKEVKTQHAPTIDKDEDQFRKTFSIAYAGLDLFDQSYFIGAVDEVRVWKKALTAREIESNARTQRLSGREAHLHGYWSFGKENNMNQFASDGFDRSTITFKSNTSHELNLSTTRRIEADGSQALETITSPIIQSPKWEEFYWLGGKSYSGHGMRNFRGKLSNVQIWDKALNTQTVRDTLHLELRGTESDLAVYYPMGGIIDESVVDFSINKLNGQVYGDPYYSERTLNRYVLDKPVAFFSNADMLAVSQSAQYTESFEFRLLDKQGDAVDPNNIDGKKAFKFLLWGKTNRSSEERIYDGFDITSENITPPEDITPLNDNEGWYSATCQFITPDTISVMRLFEISDLQGDEDSWEHMEIRKHKLQLTADASSLAPYVDTLSDLKTLADSGVDLADLPSLEQQRRQLREEKIELEKRLHTVRQFDENDNNIRVRINALKDHIVGAKKRLEKEERNPLNLYCKIYAKGFMGIKRFITPPDALQGDVFLTPMIDETMARDGGKFYWWELKKYGLRQNHYFIYRYGYGSNINRPYYLRYAEVFPHQVGTQYAARLEIGSDIGNAKVDTKIKFFDYAYLNADGVQVTTKIRPFGNPSEYTTWTIEPGIPRTLSPSGKEAIEYYKTRLKDFRFEMETLEKRDLWKRFLRVTDSELEAVELKINEIINRFNLEVVEQQNPEEIPEIHTTDNGLVTRAAYLDFVQPASRLNMMESCEGNLILSYFDTQGRMRQTNFDATADSHNMTFEQWIPETVRSCVDMRDNNASITLNNPVDLGEDWTVEFWFTTLAPHEALLWRSIYDRYHYFLSCYEEISEQGVHVNPSFFPGSKVCVREHQADSDENPPQIAMELGTLIQQEAIPDTLTNPFDDYWVGSGFDMTTLSQGWHHMAVVGTGDITKGTTTFYIDGQRVGDDTQTLWLSTQQEANEAIREAKRAKKAKKEKAARREEIREVVRVIREETEETSTNTDEVDNGTTENESDENKQHACVNNNSLIYIGNDSLRGKSPFKSQMAEVRFWDVALEPEEIEINSRSYLSGNEPGLVAYYPLSEGKGEVIRNHAAFYSLEKDIDAKALGTRWVPSTAPIGHPGDNAVSFDGISDKITFPKEILLDNTFSVEFWFKCNKGKDRSRADNAPRKDYQLIRMKIAGKEVELSVEVRSDQRLSIVIDNITSHDYALNIDGFFTDNSWHHLSLQITTESISVVFDDTQQVSDLSIGELSGNHSITLGRKNTVREGDWNRHETENFEGQIADLRVWNYHRQQPEIIADRHRRLTGSEKGLMLYCPLDSINTDDGTVLNMVSIKTDDGTVLNNDGQTVKTDTHTMQVSYTNTLPIGADAVVVNEYPTVAFDPETKKQTAMMWRFMTLPMVDKLQLLSDKRIELLEYLWVGNGQFAPTLLGYIEGAPPVPSENLTEEDDYCDATSVELSVSNNVEYSWERTQNIFTELDLDAKIGAEAEATVGTAVGIGAQAVILKNMKFESLFGVKANFQYGAQDATTITTSSALNLSDTLSLRGYQEEEAEFEHLGKRFIPKNIGYALVISSMADVFIVRLKRSRKMVSYKIQPVKDIPPQVNTITFMINPAYTMNGSLDGQVGTRAADDRFYGHVPEMRAQYGSKYPASYMKLDQALSLSNLIEKMDKESEAYFQNFNARLVDETSLDSEIGDTSTTSSISLGGSNDDGGMDDSEGAFEAEADAGADRAGDTQKEAKKSVDKYRGMAESGLESTGMFSWKKKMESLQIKAGKRNIVNSYVWDADGGLHVENQSFANSITHSIGGSFSFTGGINFDLEFKLGLAVELGIEANVGVELTMSKSEDRSKEVTLDVDLGGMEYHGVTDHLDRPLNPGEKVDRYRFSSYFLEGNTSHFNDFFDYVVDPEWLASNDEEARALRGVNRDKANKTWRVLHRVTYVERPALKPKKRS